MRLFSTIFLSWLFIKAENSMIDQRNSIIMLVPDEVFLDKIFGYLDASDYSRLMQVNRNIRTLIKTLEDARLQTAINFSLFDNFRTQGGNLVLRELRSLLYERGNWRKPLDGNELILDLLRTEREYKILTIMLLRELHVARYEGNEASFPSVDILSAAIDLTAYTCQKYFKKDPGIVSQCARLIGCSKEAAHLVKIYTTRYMNSRGRLFRAALGIEDRKLFMKIEKLKNSIIESKREMNEKSETKTSRALYVFAMICICSVSFNSNSKIVAVGFVVLLLSLLVMIGDLANYKRSSDLY